MSSILLPIVGVLVLVAIAEGVIWSWRRRDYDWRAFGVSMWVLNTPSHHRVHHARNLSYLDANYGGVLIIFDRLFGTFVPERNEEPCDYGLVTPMRSYNPFYVELHGWIGLLKDLRKARSLKTAAGFLFAPPGWAPGGGATTEDLRRQAGTAVPTGASTHPPPLATAVDA
ncbi:sterol desaturase family protein [Phenylobacterium sp.]|uniref:sterol desaturase family protein n=1 Tax=Phenylobacterium sp. TaxID=1871053 RepID=UPI00272EF2DD|nr:sterol desaturase family protein [Phenylobacterium sp.]MDP2212882.1 sterol desaturase family protein [Phenylobacterium sp.]